MNPSELEVRDIVKDYLIANGYDGLCNTDSECGCDLEDLICCSEPCDRCNPAYKHKCPEGHESDWLMTLSKEKPDFGSED